MIVTFSRYERRGESKAVLPMKCVGRGNVSEKVQASISFLLPGGNEARLMSLRTVSVYVKQEKLMSLRTVSVYVKQENFGILITHAASIHMHMCTHTVMDIPTHLHAYLTISTQLDNPRILNISITIHSL